MGGAPLLLALAVVGIDYGYQPDGAGGLEYIIQVPPQMLSQMNEVESVIDPAIRGHVSRVVVRLGKGPLPHDDGGLLGKRPASTPAASPSIATPISAANAAPPDNAGANDQGPVPIPTLPTTSPATTGRSASASPATALPKSATSVQRPQSNEANAGPSISLPPVTASTVDSQASATPNVLRLPSEPSAAPPSSLLTNAPQTGLNAPSIPAAAIPAGGSNLNDQGWKDPQQSSRAFPSTDPTNSDSGYALSRGAANTGVNNSLGATNPAYSTTNSNAYGAPALSSGNYAGSTYGSTDYSQTPANSGYNTGIVGNTGVNASNAGTTRPSYPNAYGNSLNQTWSNMDAGARDRDGLNSGLNGSTLGNLNTSSTLPASSYGNPSYPLGTVASSSAITPILPDESRSTLPTQPLTTPPSLQSPLYPNSQTGANGLNSAASAYLNQNANLIPGSRNSSGYGYDVMPLGSRQPFTHRFLDGLLMFSLIVNVYLIIAISRLIARHRDLVVSVRGSSLAAA